MTKSPRKRTHIARTATDCSSANFMVQWMDTRLYSSKRAFSLSLNDTFDLLLFHVSDIDNKITTQTGINMAANMYIKIMSNIDSNLVHASSAN